MTIKKTITLPEEVEKDPQTLTELIRSAIVEQIAKDQGVVQRVGKRWSFSVLNEVWFLIEVEGTDEMSERGVRYAFNVVNDDFSVEMKIMIRDSDFA